MHERRINCPMRHPDNGNCTVAGGFCTAVNDPICEALHNAYDCGRRSVWAELTQTKVRQEPNLDGKCGSCTHSVLAEGVFGNSNCFILRPDKDPAAVAALRAYAAATDNKILAEDIYNWVGKGESLRPQGGSG